ncbi:MAG: hypothetical protein N3E40_06045, partial [Dehalococcoidia bacterium]|nr:hypothetical protein [Dehalococcoidia bacterium]
MTTGTDFLRDSFKRLSFSEIFPGYFDIIKRYWWLIVSIGLLFGWLLSFPLQGPLFFTLLEKTGLNTEFCGSLFMIGHIAGLLLGGIAGLLMGRYLDWLAGGAIICQVVTLLIPFSVQETWATLFLSMGFFAGLAVISWVTRFSLEVPPEHRSRTFILGAILANIIVYLTSITLDLGINPNFLSVLLSLLPLAMPFLFLRNPRTLTPSQPASPSAISGERTEGLLTRAANTGIILFFVLLIYTVAGIVYYYIASNIVQTGNLLKYLGLIPYLIFLPAAGVMGDYFARRGNAICGALFIGIGFLLVSLFKGSAQFILFQIFLIGGYAFLDTFTWVIGADFFSKRNQSIGYGLILGVNMTAILLGNLAGYRL